MDGVRWVPVDGSGGHELTAPAESSASSRGFPHVSSLDGLRGVAVLAVVAFHADFGWAPGGFLGVDAFFVLSGFLITSLLRTEHAAKGSIRLGTFWARRCRRLLPALGFLFVVVILFAALHPEQPNLTTMRTDMLSGLGYVANWRFVLSDPGYFGAAAPSPLRHLWSLAIEEQFYLVWPLAFLVVIRLRRPVVAVAALAGLSSVLMIIAYETSGLTRAYYGSDTHAHGLLLGAALAFMSIKASRSLSAAALVAASGALVFFFWFDGTNAGVYRGGLVLFELLIALVIADCVANRGSRLQRVLSVRPLRAIGLVSYGLYLWHWPVFVLADEQLVGVTGYTLLAVQLVATTALTLFSYFVIEMPVRRGSISGRSARVVVPIGVGSVVAALLLVSSSLESPIENISRSARSQEALSTDHSGRFRIMLVGDSTASSMAPGIAEHARRAGMQFVDAAESGCYLDWGPADLRREGGTWKPLSRGPECNWRVTWPRLLRRYRPDLVVMLFGPNDVGDHRVDGRVYEYATAPWRRRMRRQLDSGVRTIRRGGAEVRMLLPPAFPVQPGVKPLNDVYAAAAAHWGVPVYDLGPLVNPRTAEYRWDGFHYTRAGASASGEAIVRWIEGLRDQRGSVAVGPLSN